MQEALKATHDSGWVLRHEGYDDYYYARYSYGYEQGPKETAAL